MSKKVQLPVIDASSLKRDGGRNFVHPADVSGRFVKARYVVFTLLIGFWAILPWVPVRGNPALFFDVQRRQFFLFGLTFNAQDGWLLFFVFSGVGLGIILVTPSVANFVSDFWPAWA